MLPQLRSEMRQGEVTALLASNGLHRAFATGDSFWCVESYLLADGRLCIEYIKRWEPDYRYLVTNGWLQSAWFETNGTKRVAIKIGEPTGGGFEIPPPHR
jgi:hypothetical protein